MSVEALRTRTHTTETDAVKVPAARKRVLWESLLIWALIGSTLALRNVTPAPPLGLIRLLVALPVLFFLPGYALLVFLFPGHTKLTRLELIGLSISLSLAVIVLSGLALYYAALPINQHDLLIALALLLGVLPLMAMVRKSTPWGTLASTSTQLVAFVRRLPPGDRLLLLAIIVLVVVGASAVPYRLITATPAELYTEFSILPTDGASAGPPTVSGANAERSFEVTVTNHERRPQWYEVSLSDGDTYAAHLQVDRLDDGSTWSQAVRVPVPVVAVRRLNVELFRDGESGVYRELHVWLSSSAALEGGGS